MCLSYLCESQTRAPYLEVHLTFDFSPLCNLLLILFVCFTHTEDKKETISTKSNSRNTLPYIYILQKLKPLHMFTFNSELVLVDFGTTGFQIVKCLLLQRCACMTSQLLVRFPVNQSILKRKYSRGEIAATLFVVL